jgi:hypothetical protein
MQNPADQAEAQASYRLQYEPAGMMSYTTRIPSTSMKTLGYALMLSID